jgi:hypothetical protein
MWHLFAESLGVYYPPKERVNITLSLSNSSDVPIAISNFQQPCLIQHYLIFR